MEHPNIILASASPRRRELLSRIFSKYDIIPSNFDESDVPNGIAPYELVIYLAKMKARDVAKNHADSLVIGADTIVVADDIILGKPKDSNDAANMLKQLSGREHEVITGICVIYGGKEMCSYERTSVRFRELSNQTISRYISTGEPMDKAGAYAIQGYGSVLIESISGCFFNVVGLPLYKLSKTLENFGISPLENC